MQRSYLSTTSPDLSGSDWVALYADVVSRTNFEGWITRRMDWAGGGMTAGCRFSLRGAFTVSAADMEVSMTLMAYACLGQCAEVGTYLPLYKVCRISLR
jgi:hypothetical protein